MGWQILLSIYRAFNEDVKLVSASDVLNELAKTKKAFAGTSYFKMAENGTQLE